MPIKTFGEVDERSLAQLKTCMVESAEYGVLCGDHHPGYSQPIGGVVAYRDHISVSGVGYDIGCGNLAIRTNLRGPLDYSTLADEVEDKIAFGMGRKNESPVHNSVLAGIEEAGFVRQRGLRELATSQLGTVGAGNHYVDIFEDEQSMVWIGVHSGSRGFGHKTASGFLSLAAGGRFEDKGKDTGMDGPPVLLDIHTEIGRDYIEAMNLAGAYAGANRAEIGVRVLQIMGAEPVDEVHNHHNFAWREEHFGEDFWVIRKGSTPNRPGQRSFVGASMGEPSVILIGLDTQQNTDALHSTVHGAGRVMGRREAKGRTKYNKETGVTRVIHKGKIDMVAVRADMASSRIELRGADADEAPGVYKRLKDVLVSHAGTVDVEHWLQPKVVVMAGPRVRDPYKD
jgi:tRNA-splicing ligase RtcB